MSRPNTHPATETPEGHFSATSFQMNTSCKSHKRPAMEFDAEDYACSICTELIVEPVCGPCGHEFCKLCIERWSACSKSSSGVRCPLCRESLLAPGTTTLGVSRLLERTLQRLFPTQYAERKAAVDAERAAITAQQQAEMDEQVSRVAALMKQQLAALQQRMAAHAAASPSTTSSQSTLDAAASPALDAAASRRRVYAVRSLSTGSLHLMSNQQAAMAGPMSPPPAPAASDLHQMVATTPAGQLAMRPLWQSLQAQEPQQAAMLQAQPGIPCPDAAASGSESEDSEGGEDETRQMLQQPSAAASGVSAVPAPAMLQPWHQPIEDLPMRQEVARKLVAMLYARRPAMADAARCRLPEFVGRVESALYRLAASRAEYEEASTLEARVQRLARGAVNSRRMQQHAQAPAMVNTAAASTPAAHVF